MLQKIILTVLISISSGALGLVFGQITEAAKPTYIAGEVVAVGDKKFTVNAKTGPVDVLITDKTVVKHASAESLNLTTAAAGVITDVGVGDKVTVSGILAADGKSMPARQFFYVTKADYAAKNAKDAEEWRRRGITGKVTLVNAQTNQLTVETPGMTGMTTKTVLTPKETAKFLRYAPDSIRFDEAKPSSLAEVKVGDMIRAKGDKSSDGTGFAAEEVITGAFQTIAGTVKSVDVAKNEVVISNLQNKKDITVVIGDASVLKRYPAEMAERLAGFQMAGNGARPGGQGNGQGGVQVRPATPPGNGQAQGQTPGGGRQFGGARGGPGGAAGGGIDDQFDRFPNITAADLKVGDIIALSSSKTSDLTRTKAIKLVSGVEPFIRAAQAANNRGRGGQGGGQGGGDAGGFSIPGLDGIGFP
ncbi:hypothetical protein BH10ACI2_BH10ACI2_16920 [soil metagenome]